MYTYGIVASRASTAGASVSSAIFSMLSQTTQSLSAWPTQLGPFLLESLGSPPPPLQLIRCLAARIAARAGALSRDGLASRTARHLRRLRIVIGRVAPTQSRARSAARLVATLALRLLLRLPLAPSRLSRAAFRSLAAALLAAITRAGIARAAIGRALRLHALPVRLSPRREQGGWRVLRSRGWRIRRASGAARRLGVALALLPTAPTARVRHAHPSMRARAAPVAISVAISPISPLPLPLAPLATSQSRRTFLCCAHISSHSTIRLCVDTCWTTRPSARSSTLGRSPEPSASLELSASASDARTHRPLP